MFSRLLNYLHLTYLKFHFKGFSIGENSLIDYKTRVYIGKNVLSIGNNVYIKSISRGYHTGMPFPSTFLLDRKDSIIRIGDNSNLNGVYVHAQKGITIGANTVIAAGVNIIDSNGHILHSSNRNLDRDLPEEIFIGNNVWIGLNAIILKGSIIGSNSVIGAGSVVKGIFPENSIIVGNPAKVVGIVKINS